MRAPIHEDRSCAATPGACPNCGALDVGRYCPACGQEAHRELRVPLSHLASEALAEAVGGDSRLAHTLAPLLLRPGAVTSDYLAGRRARYTSPLKVFLLASFGFFLVWALRSDNEAVQFRFRTTEELAQSARVHTPGEDEAAQPVSTQALEDRLRSWGWVGRALGDRLGALRALPPGEARRRIDAHFSQELPRVAFFLVPVLALLLRVAFRRTRRWYAEHLVFALHAHAVGFLLLLPGAALGGGAVLQLGIVASAVHLALALRRLHGLPWPTTLLRAAGVAVLYLVALVVGVTAVTLVAVLQA